MNAIQPHIDAMFEHPFDLKDVAAYIRDKRSKGRFDSDTKEDEVIDALAGVRGHFFSLANIADEGLENERTERVLQSLNHVCREDTVSGVEIELCDRAAKDYMEKVVIKNGSNVSSKEFAKMIKEATSAISSERLIHLVSNDNSIIDILIEYSSDELRARLQKALGTDSE